MKTKRILMFVAVMMMAAFSFSCNNDDGGGGGGGAAQGTITAKVDGTSVTTLQATTIAIDQGVMITIQGNDGGTSVNKTFQLVVMNIDGPGVYKIDPGLDGTSYGVYTEISDLLSGSPITKNWTAPYDGAPAGVMGEFNVQEIDATHIKGTFHFTAKNIDDGTSKNITDGSFNVNFQAY